jgi:hypothetical protein
LRLHSTTGRYDRTIVIANDFHANPAPDDTVDIYFDSVPPNASYSLTYIAADGTETVVVDSAPFHTLQDNSLPPETPAPTPEQQS